MIKNHKSEIEINMIFTIIVALISILLLISVISLKIPIFGKTIYCSALNNYIARLFNVKINQEICKENNNNVFLITPSKINKHLFELKDEKHAFIELPYKKNNQYFNKIILKYDKNITHFSLNIKPKNNNQNKIKYTINFNDNHEYLKNLISINKPTFLDLSKYINNKKIKSIEFEILEQTDQNKLILYNLSVEYLECKTQSILEALLYQVYLDNKEIVFSISKKCKNYDDINFLKTFIKLKTNNKISLDTNLNELKTNTNYILKPNLDKDKILLK